MDNTKKIERWLKNYDIKKYSIINGIIDADNVWIFDENLKKFPSYIKFNIVKGNFIVKGCCSLTSMCGFPKEVKKNFDVSGTALSNLKGCPQIIGRDFYCCECAKLISLEGSPKEINGNFEAFLNNSLKTLEGGPKKVGGNYGVDGCNSLISLKGCPSIIPSELGLYGCMKLRKLNPGPKQVKILNTCFCGEKSIKKSEINKIKFEVHLNDYTQEIEVRKNNKK